MTKHTAGPWKYNGNKVVTNGQIESDRTFGYGCENDFVCDLDDGEYHNYMSESEKDANGFLIAAAPDLLAVCEFMLERGIFNDQLIYAVRKAKGGQSE